FDVAASEARTTASARTMIAPRCFLFTAPSFASFGSVPGGWSCKLRNCTGGFTADLDVVPRSEDACGRLTDADIFASLLDTRARRLAPPAQALGSDTL